MSLIKDWRGGCANQAPINCNSDKGQGAKSSKLWNNFLISIRSNAFTNRDGCKRKFCKSAKGTYKRHQVSNPNAVEIYSTKTGAKIRKLRMLPLMLDREHHSNIRRRLSATSLASSGHSMWGSGQARHLSGRSGPLRGNFGAAATAAAATSRLFPEKALVAAAAAGCVLWQNLHGTKTSSAAPGHCTLPFLLLQSFKGKNVFLLLLESRERAKIFSVHFHITCTLHFVAPLLWYI